MYPGRWDDIANCLVDSYAHDSRVEPFLYERQRRADVYLKLADTSTVLGKFSIMERSPSETEVTWRDNNSALGVGGDVARQNADRCARSG
jgi:hypothetical protein